MPWSRNTSWRQGSVLAQKDFQAVGLSDVPDADLAIAISHDCDIANDNLDVEPTVEFIFARILEECDGNYTHGKNPRTLHLEYTHGETPVFLKLLAPERFILDKNTLEAVQPDESYGLTPRSRQILQNWLAARYRRHALPNSLVDRLREFLKHIDKKGKQNSSGILFFRLSYDPEHELPSEEPYELRLYVVYVTDKEEYSTIAQEIVQNLKTEFPKLLEKTKNCGTVILCSCEAVSEMEFTVRDMRDTVEYHLEHLSYRTEPPDPVI
ncbi:hypothetical protein H6G80_26545 [Nostoc sp. FACHB-87]|uniref:hypothetical protein n=1 Tax=Nostocales TaxID=1161 RepID=UPI001686F828|nr:MULTISPECIES: hypothetical protein [Nostocales]MBD2298819.1 hypothetical protein [Nostoc sp. FACHB-190]MBD2457618.1 hypothetical protein [Nostoc sp. FACHB-87]MBD2477487.1 hypothetical protein [Anabaena sp. FACHB-83]MBD2487666.1 hypothetical protein [Aulosira sp. FACHB-615]